VVRLTTLRPRMLAAPLLTWRLPPQLQMSFQFRHWRQRLQTKQIPRPPLTRPWKAKEHWRQWLNRKGDFPADGPKRLVKHQLQPRWPPRNRFELPDGWPLLLVQPDLQQVLLPWRMLTKTRHLQMLEQLQTRLSPTRQLQLQQLEAREFRSPLGVQLVRQWKAKEH